METKICPKCEVKMKVRGTQAFNEEGALQWFYFVYCGLCGGGPRIGAADPIGALHCGL